MNKAFNLVHALSMLVAFVGVVLYVFGVREGYLVLGAGAVAMFLVRLFAHAKAEDKTERRQIMILVAGSVFLMAAVYIMYQSKRYWVIPLLVDALVELYISFRMKR